MLTHFNDFFSCFIGIGIEQIVYHGVIEDMNVLTHDANFLMRNKVLFDRRKMVSGLLLGNFLTKAL